MEDHLLNQILSELKKVNERIDSLSSEVSELHGDMHSGFENVNKKLDTISEQVAHNTEQYIGLSAKVDELETDVRLIKKLLTNQ